MNAFHYETETTTRPKNPNHSKNPCTSYPAGQLPQISRLMSENAEFLGVLGKALSSVQSVRITLMSQPEPFTDAAIADFYLPVLQQLSKALPGIRFLSVYGPIHSEALKAFGESCPNLSSLDIGTKQQQLSSLSGISTLLPLVDTVSFHPESPFEYLQTQQNLAEAISVLDGRNIKHLDLGHGNLDSDMWYYLPRGLISLRVDNKNRVNEFEIRQARFDGVFPELTHVTWNCTLQEALMMKDYCPYLSCFDGSVSTSCEYSEMVGWNEWSSIVQSPFRWSGGLILTESEEQSDFLKLVRPMKRVTHVSFLSSGGQNLFFGSSSWVIARLFPAVTHITTTQPITDKELPFLLMNKFLEQLELDGGHVSMLGLGLLYSKHPRLSGISVRGTHKLNIKELRAVLRSFDCRSELGIR